jgi:DNA-binding GntR family transcriptional regulator
VLMLKPLPIQRTTVTTEAAGYLREQIVTGRLRPGEGLPENRMGELLGVSRAPVREALTLLEREGLVTFDRRGTARVCRFGPDDIRELGLMRVALEPLASRLACERMTEDLARSLQNNLQDLRKARTLTDVTQLDVEFHRIIVKASGNHRLYLSWQHLANQFIVVMGQFHRSIESKTRLTRDLTLKSHQEMVAVLMKGNLNAIESLARHHAASWLTGWEDADGFGSPDTGTP